MACPKAAAAPPEASGQGRGGGEEGLASAAFGLLCGTEAGSDEGFPRTPANTSGALASAEGLVGGSREHGREDCERASGEEGAPSSSANASAESAIGAGA